MFILSGASGEAKSKANFFEYHNCILLAYHNRWISSGVTKNGFFLGFLPVLSFLCSNWCDLSQILYKIWNYHDDEWYPQYDRIFRGFPGFSRFFPVFLRFSRFSRFSRFFTDFIVSDGFSIHRCFIAKQPKYFHPVN